MTETKREYISLLRNKLKEVNADSIFTNKFLYSSLEEQAKWLIRREWYAGKLRLNASLFQKLPCFKTEPVNKVDCPHFLQGETIFKTVCKIPRMWGHDLGPMIVRVSSIDNYTEFKLVSSTSSINKEHSPYKKYFKEKWCYYEGGYLYFTEDPKRITIRAFFKENISHYDCEGVNHCPCEKYLDTPFFLPEGMQAELIEKTFQTIFNTKKIPFDENINSNTSN